MSIQPPRPKGPPLNALRAFEAAARLASFTRAGDELSVTPGAIAQHVRALEEWAGAPLFHRKAQGVVLTPLGTATLPVLGQAFDRLAEAGHLMRRLAAPAEIRIAALPSVAQLWLSPRLRKIRALEPKPIISVTALERPPNLAREPFDIAIFFGIQASPDLTILPLAEDALVPVASPAIAARLAHPSDLRRETLLHDASWRDDWSTWLNASPLAGAGVDPATGPVFSLYALAVEEALHGAGVLIGHTALVGHCLAEGALVQPFPPAIPSAPLVAAIRVADEAEAAGTAGTIAQVVRHLATDVQHD